MASTACLVPFLFGPRVALGRHPLVTRRCSATDIGIVPLLQGVCCAVCSRSLFASALACLDIPDGSSVKSWLLRVRPDCVFPPELLHVSDPDLEPFAPVRWDAVSDAISIWHDGGFSSLLMLTSFLQASGRSRTQELNPASRVSATITRAPPFFERNCM